MVWHKTPRRLVNMLTTAYLPVNKHHIPLSPTLPRYHPQPNLASLWFCCVPLSNHHVFTVPLLSYADTHSFSLLEMPSHEQKLTFLYSRKPLSCTYGLGNPAPSIIFWNPTTPSVFFSQTPNRGSASTNLFRSAPLNNRVSILYSCNKGQIWV